MASAVPQMPVIDKQVIVNLAENENRPVSLSRVFGFGNGGQRGRDGGYRAVIGVRWGLSGCDWGVR